MRFSIRWYGGSHRTLKPASSAIVSMAGFPLNCVGYFQQTANISIFVLYLSSPFLPLIFISSSVALHLPIHSTNSAFPILLIVSLEMNHGMFAQNFEVFLENESIHI